MITSNPEPLRQLWTTSVESVELDGGVLVLIGGEIDAQSAPDVARQLRAYGQHRLLVDLSAVDFFDTSAVAVLLATAHRVRGLGGSLRIVAVSPLGRRLLELLDLSTFFGLDPAAENLGTDDRSGGTCPAP